jgi:hypothetical protein
LYFIVQNLAQNEEEVVRYAAILRGTESAWQAISYGVESVEIIGRVGGVYLNFGLWAVAIVPAWLVIRHFGTSSTKETASDVSDGNNSGEQAEVSVQVSGK